MCLYHTLGSFPEFLTWFIIRYWFKYRDNKDDEEIYKDNIIINLKKRENLVTGQNDSIIYSLLESLTQLEIVAFQSDEFTLENIPINPPPKEACIWLVELWERDDMTSSLPKWHISPHVISALSDFKNIKISAKRRFRNQPHFLFE